MSGLGAGQGPRVGDAPWRVRGRCRSCLSAGSRENKGVGQEERREEIEVRQERKKENERKGRGGVENTRKIKKDGRQKIKKGCT